MRIKSNGPMPRQTRRNVAHLVGCIQALPPRHRAPAQQFLDEVTPVGLFEILHGMRRWYSGQTMAKLLRHHRDHLRNVMRLEPEDVVGVFRGFHAPRDSRFAKAVPGQRLVLPVTRNRGLSSWSLTEGPTSRFSGASKEQVGVVVRLVDARGAVPILAPPARTDDWFNKLYAVCVGSAYREKEDEYLISGPRVHVEVVRVKR